jgi:DNA (cytosine-5)-methyltransferase 1
MEPQRMRREFGFYEFFAGGGMTRAGLGESWKCLYANDKDDLKAKVYAANWGEAHFDHKDISEVNAKDLSEMADLAWASFPCQDLSVAGSGLGIGLADGSEGTRSGALWPFLDLMAEQKKRHRQPPLIVLENVVGLLTLEGGRDFAAICESLSRLGYRFGAVVIDARYFVAQSRPRVFIVAVKRDVGIPRKLQADGPVKEWHTKILQRAFEGLDARLQREWIWWDLGKAPKPSPGALKKVIQEDGVQWNTQAETNRLISLMTPSHLNRLREAKKLGVMQIGSLYLRMRKENGVNHQRAEITFAPTLGCLRTPRGGASRPRIIVVKDGTVRTRLLSAGEAARLMGLPKSYVLPDVYHPAFKIIGDGVVVPVVRFLADRLLEPIAQSCLKLGRVA